MIYYDTAFFAGRRDTVMPSASVIAALLDGMLHPTSVLDVGCGQGEFLEALGVSDSVGVDVFPNEDTLYASFVQHDLTEPLDLERKFDVVLCLEVGEHLHEEAAGTLVDTIARHGDSVVFSAAVPGQTGYGHVNCQPHEYWHDKFGKRGFECVDDLRPVLRRNPSVKPWYSNNIFRYIR